MGEPRTCLRTFLWRSPWSVLRLGGKRDLREAYGRELGEKG
jgi:hypothetical protein